MIPNQGAFTQADITAILAGQSTPWTGNTFYIDPVNGSDQNDGQVTYSNSNAAGHGPVQSLAAGYALLVSGNNDTLVLIANGATSGTARLDKAFTWSKSACRFVGICPPGLFSQRARIAPTGTTTAFKLFFTLSGSGNLFQNLQWFHGFNAGTTAQICMTITGSRNVFQNCHIAGMGDTASAQDTGSRSLVIKQDENLFVNCVIGIDTVVRTVLNGSVEFAAGSAGAARNAFVDCIFPVLASAAASSLVVLVAAAAALDRINLFRRCTFWNAAAFSGGAAATGVAKLLAASGGALLFQDCTEYGFTDWGYDAASKLQVLVSGPVPTSNTSGIAVVNT